MHFHFRIQLTNISKPPVWRELTVPALFSFEQFHSVIQAAFGWKDAHLYLFSPDGFASSPWIKIPEEEDEDEDVRILDARTTSLKDIFPAHQHYTYTYDFGDDWRHKIKLLRIGEGTAKHATLFAGKGACPPEDCGGHWGYEAMKEKLKDPGDPEYSELHDWLGLEEGEEWNPAAFDLAETQLLVSSMKTK